MSISTDVLRETLARVMYGHTAAAQSVPWPEVEQPLRDLYLERAQWCIDSPELTVATTDSQPAKQYAPTEPPTRDELIALCQDGFVPQERWSDRDSARAHMQLGECLALLSAGCHFDVTPDGKTFHVHIEYRGFDWFEGGYDDEDHYLSNDRFYVPTRARLDEVDGGDWYC